MSALIFVYGSLLRGLHNHRLLEVGARFIGRAWTEPRFRLVSLGSFPALLAGGETSIAGELFEVTDEVLARLDRLEGHPSFYRRERITIEVLSTGDVAAPATIPDEVQAYVYQERNGMIRGGDIASGSWRSHVEASGR